MEQCSGIKVLKLEFNKRGGMCFENGIFFGMVQEIFWRNIIGGVE